MPVACCKVQHALFDKLVFAKIRDRFGGRVRFFISGAAALNRDIAEWFHAAGILILEGYGLTETSAGAVRQPPRRLPVRHRRPVVPRHRGQDRRGRRDPDQGPGRHGRLPQPARGDRRGADDDGWLHTGDIGELDDEGFLRITDRKKDLFKTSGGKYIAPSAIEAQFKAICPYASQFMVHGNERNFCVALVTLDPDAIDRLGRARTAMAGTSYAELVGLRRGAREMVGGLRRGAERPAEPLGDDQEVACCSTTT